MLTKRSVIVLLVGLNVALLTVLVFGSYALPAALGQTGGGSAGDFVCVTANVAGQSYDVLYVLDVPNHKLHAFYPPSVQTKQLSYGKYRDLRADFGQPK